MGYNSTFEGKFNITPTLSLEMVNTLKDFNSKRHERGPSHYCQWEPSEDGKSLQWDGGENFYSSKEWLRYIILVFLVPNGYGLEDGAVFRHGEDSEDHEKIRVIQNEVKSFKGKIVYEEEIF